MNNVQRLALQQAAKRKWPDSGSTRFTRGAGNRTENGGTGWRKQRSTFLGGYNPSDPRLRF